MIKTKRQQNKDKRQLQSELNNLQQTYRKLQSKMTPQDKLSYEAKNREFLVGELWAGFYQFSQSPSHLVLLHLLSIFIE